MVGQPLGQPEKLSPRPLGAEKLQDVDPQLPLEVVFKRLAVVLDQRDEARVPPGGAAASPKWSAMSATKPLSTLAGSWRTSS